MEKTDNKKIFNQFSKGFISTLDIDTLKVPPDALSDCLNVEINNPLLAISASKGYKTDLVIPTYSGSENVAMRKWSVTNPSSKELTTLIRKSNNLLKYSEFFFTPDWSFTAGGATMTPTYADAPKRKSTRFTSCSNSTRLVQSVIGIDGGIYTYSIYVKNASHTQFSMSIGFSAGSFFNTVGSGWERFEISTNSLVGTTADISIQFTGATGTEEFEIWGAQLEYGVATASGYGYTVGYVEPYYFYLRPYFDGNPSVNDWVDDWLELNEVNSGIITSVPDIVNYEWNPSNYALNYFTWWCLGKIGAQADGEIIYQSGSNYLTTSVGNSGGMIANDQFILSRFANHQNIELSNSTIRNENITFVENNGIQTIGLGVNCTPLKISYINVALFDEYSPAQAIEFNGFNLTPENRYNSSNYESGSVAIVSVDNGSGSIPAGTYSYYYVLVVSGQRFCIEKGTFTTVGGTSNVTLTVDFTVAFFTYDCERVEIYINPTDGDTDEANAYLNYSYDLRDNSAVTNFQTGTPPCSSTTFINSILIATSSTINSIATSQNSLTQNIQRGFDTASLASYDIKQYLRGRSYIAGVNNANNAFSPTSYNYVRFSSVANLVQETNVYPFKESASYGYVLTDNGNAEKVMGLGVTPQSDLLIFKEKSTLLYEIASQSSALGKKLLNVFNGIGCSNWRGIASTDFGTFWYDQNDIYLYTGGVNVPKRISTGKVSKWWRSLIDSNGNHFSKSGNKASGFAKFVKSLNEYWIFIRTTDSGGSYTDYLILRYSVEFENFNLLRMKDVIIGADESLSNELCLLTYTGNIIKFGYTDNLLDASYFTTHKVNISDDYDYKRLISSWCEKDTTNNLTLQIFLNDESSARTGNSVSFLSTKKNNSFMSRNGSVFRKISFKALHASAGIKFNVSEIGLEWKGEDRPRVR